MKHATGGIGQLPSTSAMSIGSAMSDVVTDDSNWPSIFHALCSCGALILLMPTGIVFLRLAPKNARWHWINQSISTIIAIIAIILDFYLSTMFTKSQNYTSAHQVIGIIILLATLVQWDMDAGNHLMYRRTQRPTKLGPIHRYFGYFFLFLAIPNGGIGLTWPDPMRLKGSSFATPLPYSSWVDYQSLSLYGPDRPSIPSTNITWVYLNWIILKQKLSEGCNNHKCLLCLVLSIILTFSLGTILNIISSVFNYLSCLFTN